VTIGSFLALAVVLATAVTTPTAEDDVQGLLHTLGIQSPPGELAAPSFALPDTKGSPVRLSEYRGRTVMLYFWTTY